MTDKDKVEEPKKAEPEPKKAEPKKAETIFAENEVKKVGERDTTNDFKGA